MKKEKQFAILFASVMLLSACSLNNAYDNLPETMTGIGTGTGNGGVTAGSGELSTFDVSIDRTTAEPASTASATYPDAADDINQQAFATIVNIDMANPVATTDNGVNITVSDGHVTTNHGSTQGVCYVVSGTTANGSLTIQGNTAYEVNLNGTDITSAASAALNLDSKQAAYVVLTGSNNLQLMQRVTQSLAGRTAVLTLLPLSIEELTGNDRLLSCFKLMYNGFYPAVWAQNLPAQDMYRQYFNTYIQRDIRQVLNVKNLDEFRKFLVIAASRIGTEFNAQSISNELGVSLPTVLDWMNVLEATYVAFRLRPFYRNIGKRLIKTPKIYFYDVGLVCYLLGITKPSQLETHPLRGQVFENMVVCEFIKYQFNRGRDNDIYFFRDRSQREVDIVIDRGLDELHAFEVKLASTIHPDFYNNLKYFRSLFTDQTRTTQVINTGASSVYSPETGHINFWDIPTTLTRIEDTTH